MIKIENVVTPSAEQWEAIIRGTRNPMNSWNKSDSFICDASITGECKFECNFDCSEPVMCTNGDLGYCIGNNDFDLMKRLVKAGTDHRKYMRMIVVYADITAPLYWWKEFDTYKVGTVRNSCSTMHKIQEKEFTLDDFSFERCVEPLECNAVVGILESLRKNYINYDEYRKFIKENDLGNPDSKEDLWYTIIQFLPSSYNQRATVMFNYEVLANIYHSRKNHKLNEWVEFCKWIESLPYSELITGGEE